MQVTRVSHSCLLIELGPICKSMAAPLCFKSCEDHSLLKAKMEVYGKTFTGLGPVPFLNNWSISIIAISSLLFILDQCFVVKAKHGCRFSDLVHIQDHTENSPDPLKSC